MTVTIQSPTLSEGLYPRAAVEEALAGLATGAATSIRWIPVPGGCILRAQGETADAAAKCLKITLNEVWMSAAERLLSAS